MPVFEFEITDEQKGWIRRADTLKEAYDAVKEGGVDAEVNIGSEFHRDVQIESCRQCDGVIL